MDDRSDPETDDPGAQALLGRAEVETLVDDFGLGGYRAAIIDAVLGGYRLEPGGDRRTRIGGLPDMRDDEVWPRADDGTPYTFVAQVDCSALPPLTGDFPGTMWRHEDALVRIFARVAARAPERGPELALACPPDAAVARAALPARPTQMPADACQPDDDSLRVLHETPVRAVPFLSVPVGWYVLPEDVRGAPATADAYRDFAARLAEGRAPRPDTPGNPQLLGHAVTMQAQDPRWAGGWLFRDEPDLQGLEPWCVLLNIDDGYEHLSFGDGGALAIVAPAADLAAGRYHRLVTEPTMG